MGLDFDCDFCESSHYFGKSGTCGNGTCFCDDGFSGKDDLLSFSGCQVNDKLRATTHLVVAILSLLTFVICLISLIIQVKKWKFHFCPKFQHLKNENELKSEKQRPNSFFYPPKRDSNNDGSYRNWKRKILTLATIFAFILYSFGGILYNAAMLDGSNREDHKLAVAVGYYLIIGAGFLGGFLIILVWFYSLPDISAYGNLLNMNKYLVKYPKFVPRCLFANGIIIEVGFSISVVIIPIYTHDAEILLISDYFGVATMIYAFVVAISVWWITMDTTDLVFSVFIESVSLPEGSKISLSPVQQSELLQMKRALKPIKMAKWICTVTLIIACFLQILNLVTGTSQIFLHSTLTLVFSLSIILMPLCFVILDDILSPQEKLQPNQVLL